MRAVAVFVAAVGMFLAVTAPAQAFKFDVTWAYGVIADNPFNDPDSGALLPPTAVFPRGQVKDAGTPDCCAVKMTMTALGTAGQPLTSYAVPDGQAVYRNIDRRIDTSPNTIVAVRYDLCRSDGQCATHTIARPASPAPTPQPGVSPTPTPTPAPPSPAVDQDGDGYPSSVDCSDVNNTVHPGAREIPGNGIDDDCSGGDQPGKVLAIVKSDWTVTRRTDPRVKLLQVRDAPAGAQVDVLCRGRGCPFKQRRKVLDANGEVSLTKLFKHRLRHGITIDVVISSPNMISKVTRYVIKHGANPSGRSMCIPLGSNTPQRRC
jgi:hypothetical protein